MHAIPRAAKPSVLTVLPPLVDTVYEMWAEYP
jgi:hypothetical protein